VCVSDLHGAASLLHVEALHRMRYQLGWSVWQTLHLVVPASIESPTRNSRAAAFYRLNAFAPIAWCALSATVVPHTLPFEIVILAWTSTAISKSHAELSLCVTTCQDPVGRGTAYVYRFSVVGMCICSCLSGSGK
jgi:hypothetical protein